MTSILRPSALPILREHRDDTALSIFLRDRREERALNLTEAAAALGMSRTYVWGLEHGRHVPSLLMAGKLAEVYGTHIRNLYELMMKDEGYYNALRSGKARK